MTGKKKKRGSKSLDESAMVQVDDSVPSAPVTPVKLVLPPAAKRRRLSPLRMSAPVKVRNVKCES